MKNLALLLLALAPLARAAAPATNAVPALSPFFPPAFENLRLGMTFDELRAARAPFGELSSHWIGACSRMDEVDPDGTTAIYIGNTNATPRLDAACFLFPADKTTECISVANERLGPPSQRKTVFSESGTLLDAEIWTSDEAFAALCRLAKPERHVPTNSNDRVEWFVSSRDSVSRWPDRTERRFFEVLLDESRISESGKPVLCDDVLPSPEEIVKCTVWRRGQGDTLVPLEAARDLLAAFDGFSDFEVERLLLPDDRTTGENFRSIWFWMGPCNSIALRVAPDGTKAFVCRVLRRIPEDRVESIRALLEAIH